MNIRTNLFHPLRAISKSITASEQILQKRINIIQDQIDNYRRAIVCDRLKHTVLTSDDVGITSKPICNHEVVVSLTTYRERIHEVYLTIESIMQGTLKPNRIILWLAKDEFGGKELPIVLQRQLKRGLEVRYCEDIRSYKKIIPTLSLCPDSCIVTIDDDAIYEPDLLEHLIESYKNNPECVSACRIHRIKTDKNGMPLPYRQWDMLQHNDTPSHYNYLTSGGGTIFPPYSLYNQVVDRNSFMALCPNGDDIWLNAMLVLNGVKVAKAFTHNINGEDFIFNENPYVESLWTQNQNDNGNDPQIKAVWEKYGLFTIFKNK